MYTLVFARPALRVVGAATRKFPAQAYTPARAALRFSSTMHDNDPETLEQEKKRSLSGRGTQHKDSDKTPHAHAPGWNEPLASASEAAVKADQAHGTPQDLQKRTVEGHSYSRGASDEGKPAKEKDDSEWTRRRQ
ncbi:hypothetical protein DFH06DRAFT_1291170 [Mycena polygramma]|nr:hypothetical protein DFH06DRAFT_1291170 [Mycena polygramma]